MAFHDNLQVTQGKMKNMTRLIQRFHIEDIQGEHLIEKSVPYDSMMRDLKKIEEVKQNIENTIDNICETNSDDLKVPENQEKLETLLDELADNHSKFMKAYSSHCTELRNNSQGPTKKKVEMKSQDTSERNANDCSSSSDKVSSTHTSIRTGNPNLRKQKSEDLKSKSNLFNKILNYSENGVYLTHLPQFIETSKYIINQYQKKLPVFG